MKIENLTNSFLSVFIKIIYHIPQLQEQNNMQATNTQGKPNQRLATAVTMFFIGIAIVLFGGVISRMGLFNRLSSGATATSTGSVQAVAGDDTQQLTAEAMRFGLPELRLKAGQEVTLALDNLDMYGHSFDVDELDLHVEMPANGQVEASFTPTEPGTYTVYCKVPGHREAGMVSSLIVEE